MKQLRLWRPSWIYDVTQALCHIFGSNTRLYMIRGAISKASKVVSPFLHSKSHGLTYAPTLLCIAQFLGCIPTIKFRSEGDSLNDLSRPLDSDMKTIKTLKSPN